MLETLDLDYLISTVTNLCHEFSSMYNMFYELSDDNWSFISSFLYHGYLKTLYVVEYGTLYSQYL